MGIQSENNQTTWRFVLHLFGSDSVTFWINYRAKLSKTKAILDYFRNSIENCSIDHGSSGTEFWRATTGQYLSRGWGEGGGVGRFGFVTIKFTNHPPARGWSPLTVLRVSLQTLHWLVTTTSNDAMYLTSYSSTEFQEALRSTPPEMSERSFKVFFWQCTIYIFLFNNAKRWLSQSEI